MGVTVRDVASRAKVSIATVSRALNHLPVSKAALERVRSAAAELGYVPNESARALRSDRTLTMGLIFSDLRNMLGVDLLDALSASIEEAGYSLMIATARGQAERYDLLMRRFLERRVDGLFCVFPSGPTETLSQYLAAGTPVLTMFNRGRSFAGQPLVSPTFTAAAAEVSAALRSLGHRRVGILAPETRSPPTAAIARRLAADGVAMTDLAPPDALGMRRLLAELMAAPERPTAVVAAQPYAGGFADACLQAGIAPGALSLVVVSDAASEPEHARRDLSTVAVDPHHMGRACAAAMLGWLGGARPPDRAEVQGAAFVARGSLARAS